MSLGRCGRERVDQLQLPSDRPPLLSIVKSDSKDHLFRCGDQRHSDRRDAIGHHTRKYEADRSRVSDGRSLARTSLRVGDLVCAAGVGRGVAIDILAERLQHFRERITSIHVKSM